MIITYCKLLIFISLANKVFNDEMDDDYDGEYVPFPRNSRILPLSGPYGYSDSPQSFAPPSPPPPPPPPPLPLPPPMPILPSVLPPMFAPEIVLPYVPNIIYEEYEDNYGYGYDDNYQDPYEDDDGYYGGRGHDYMKYGKNYKRHKKGSYKSNKYQGLGDYHGNKQYGRKHSKYGSKMNRYGHKYNGRRGGRQSQLGSGRFNGMSGMGGRYSRIGGSSFMGSAGRYGSIYG